MNTVFLNGAFVNAAEARVSVFDRGFLYGDGVFETIRVQEGHPFRWSRHFSRLTAGLSLLGIRLPYEETELRRHANALIAANHCPDVILRLTVSRGPGRRGLSPKDAETPTVVMSLHPGPDRTRATALRLVTSPFRVLAGDPLAAVKSASKLGYVLARQFADAAGADDALILNHRDEVAETTSSNLFWMRGDTLFTPAGGVGILPGVARGAVLELAPTLGCEVQEVAANHASLSDAECVFATNVVTGVVEVIEIDGQGIKGSERCAALGRALEDLVRAESR
ncbi:MAG TPA: aminotransferase class IV [Verrucomicrobiae bacterium]|nr:aminotransferase class IV [Verrucomicrobiae bacterium]